MALVGHKPPHTLRAIVAVLDGKVVGMIGVVQEPEVGKFFVDFTLELQPYLQSITIMRAVKASLALCDDYLRLNIFCS